jgi:hypothetical protein
MENAETVTGNITLDEIVSNLSNRNTLGRNSCKRGIRGDIEEYLGWHLDNLSDSPLTERDRVLALRIINDVDFMKSSEMAGTDLKDFISQKIDELSIDEVDNYIKNRQSNSDKTEKEEIKLLCNSVNELDEKLLSLCAGHTKVPIRERVGPVYTEIDRLLRERDDKKLEIYKLMYNERVS